MKQKPSIKDFLIFLHGPSGAGKGEVQRKLTQHYEQEGYTVFYLSSGDLFRQASSDPEIAARITAGEFPTGLGRIMPGLQAAYEQFLRTLLDTDGKAILILDGFIRQEGQIEEEAQALSEVNQKIALESDKFRELFPLYRHPKHADALVANTQAEMRNAHHILIDIHPQDAENQMRRRANKELAQIDQQLQELFGGDPEKTTTLNPLLERLSAVLNGGFAIHEGELVLLPGNEWGDGSSPEMYPTLDQEIEDVRKQLAALVGMEGASSFVDSLKQIGITTELRDDDLKPGSRARRISNYIKITYTTEGMVYSPGDAARALMKGLGFQFDETSQRFYSPHDNGVVIENGSEKGIHLADFQHFCETLGKLLESETEQSRELVLARSKHEGWEGIVRNRRGVEGW